MSLSKQKGNMYDFVTHTWNPIKGRCPHDCAYCYMKRWGKQPELHLDEKCLKDDLGEGNTVFVGSSTDMWAKGIEKDWIRKVLAKCERHDNTYLFQSKNPKRFGEFAFPDKTILCTTIETNRDYSEFMGDTPDPYKRAYALSDLVDINHAEAMVTIEPVMDFDIGELIYLIKMVEPFQVNIGADSKRSSLPEPSAEKIEKLISGLQTFTKVHLKKNISRLGVNQ